MLSTPSSLSPYWYRGLLLKPVKVPLDEHFIDNVGVNWFCICFCAREVLDHSSLSERRAAPQSQLCKPGTPCCPGTHCPVPSFTDTLWHPAVSNSSAQSVAGSQEGNRDSFVSSAVTDGLVWLPAPQDRLGCPATSISGRAGLSCQALREKECRRIAGGTARSCSGVGGADRNNNTAGATSAPSSSALTRMVNRARVSSSLLCSVSSLSAEATSHW